MELADLSHMPPGRLLGLDLGTKTIGIAFCDAQWHFASPFKTWPRTKFSKDKPLLEALIIEQNIKGLVIGHPINMDGSDSPRAQASRAYARELMSVGLPLLLWDERLSTQAVTRTMIEADLSRAKQAARVDAHAAAHILQGAIDALAHVPRAAN